jgi:hypothetical protein
MGRMMNQRKKKKAEKGGDETTKSKRINSAYSSNTLKEKE